MKWTWNRQPLCSEQCESVCRVCCALWSTRWTRWNNSSWTFQSSLHAVCHRFSIISLFAKSSFLEPLKWKTNFGVVFLGFFLSSKVFLKRPLNKVQIWLQAWDSVLSQPSTTVYRWRAFNRPHGLKKTSIMQSKRYDPHPKWPCLETNDHTSPLKML